MKKINRAEAEFWRAVARDARRRLVDEPNFECGGQQWVNECCFPAGTRSAPDGKDMRYMLRLLDIIEGEGIPAPSTDRAALDGQFDIFIKPGAVVGRGRCSAGPASSCTCRPTTSTCGRASAARFRRYKGRCEGPLACLWCPRALGQGRGRRSRACRSIDAECGRSGRRGGAGNLQTTRPLSNPS